MKLVISTKKPTVTHGQAQPPVDELALKAAISSPAATVSKDIVTDKELEAYVSNKTQQGYLCHVFAYEGSFKAETVVQSFSVAA